jgi:hypothetical protein
MVEGDDDVFTVNLVKEELVAFARGLGGQSLSKNLGGRRCTESKLVRNL